MQLTTGNATANLSNINGRAILSARGHHFIVDSPSVLDGPNEELNPIDLLMSALGSCGAFISEAVAREERIALEQVKVDVAGDFDPRGICGKPVASKIQAIRVRLTHKGPTDEEAARISDAFKKRCPIYATLIEATPIDVQIDLLTDD